MTLKFVDGFSASTSDAIRACNYAKQMRDLWVSTGGLKGANLRVLNNSYGSTGFTQSFLDAINALNQSGILMVAAAGNLDGFSVEPDNDVLPYYPASYNAPNVIAVASTTSTDGLASDSHFGFSSVDLGAPGVGILSTTPGNIYGFSSGTSMATPHVAGAAALLLAQNPNLTINQLKSLLIFNGDLAPALSGKTLTGRRLNVFNSLQALAENDVTPPGTVTNFHLNSQNGRALNVGWTASGDDGASGQASLYQLSFTDATSGAVVLFPSVLPAASGVTQAVNVKLPYRHTNGTLTLREFDNAGNEGVPATQAITVNPVVGDPYLTSEGSPVALSTGGVGQSVKCDDCFKTQTLPFSFPFFGENFTSATLSSNGSIYFGPHPATDSGSSAVALSQSKMIAGLWDDLMTDTRFDDDIYMVTPDATRVIFRWQGVTFDDNPALQFPVNFEIELRSNGTVLTRYGAGNTHVKPVVGISGGEPDVYLISSHTSEQAETNLTNASEITFLPRGPGTVASLTVASSNPASGVNITVSPNDENSLGNGTTQFTRSYQIGSIVNLTAPPTASGNNFLKWQRDGVDSVTTQATSVTMDAAHTMTAVYVTPRTLTVASSNPSSGVNITVTPADNSSLGNGATPFARTYNDGIVVNLTAPATAGGNNFLKWQRDGVDWATTPATSITIDADRTITAVYVTPTPRTLTVASANPSSGVNITVTPNDNGGLSNGATPFPRGYNDGIVVNLTAPATASGNNFLKWQRDGVDWATTPATSITIDANRTMTAVYVTPRTLTVASANPSSGVNITVTPADNSSLGNGATPFARTYNDGTVVNLTAPATASGNNFLKWQRDGADWATTQATSVTMDANRTMTAVYVTPRTLTVGSSLPDSGVSITVTPNDNGGLSNGATPFTRTYNDGVVVNLTAPATASGNNFLKWQRDGVDWATTQATSVTMDVNHTMTAVFNNSVQFTVPQFSAFEPLSPPCTGSPACEGSVTVTVSRAGGTSAPASVNYTTSDDVATQKGDYIFSAGTLNFAIGEASKSFTVFIVDDVFQEGTETFKVILSNPVGTTLGVRSVADVKIFDNDGTPGATNPLDNADARFYVRQHYLDFLNREPDPGGLAFWTDQITSCGTDQACIDIRRINVSAAFFLSIEFQQTGYLVERLYKTSYGDATGTSTFGGVHQLSVPIVRYTEFMIDSQEISRGVVIGQPGADQLLENNKEVFIASFVQRSRFTTAFPASLTPAEFVDALNAKAGGALSPSERDQLVSDLTSGAKTRAQVLRTIAEDSDLVSAEKNRAFVLMQYFGYLRRNPNDAPDSDYTGYDFWLTKLIQFNGNFVTADMVKAFLVSGEYRQRFGP